MMLKLFLLSLLGHQHHVLSESTFVCPTATGTYPHPDVNTHFYQCVDGSPVLQNCSMGIFDSAMGTCFETQPEDNVTTARPDVTDHTVESATSASPLSTTYTEDSKITKIILTSAEDSSMPENLSSTAQLNTTSSAPSLSETTSNVNSITETKKNVNMKMDEAVQEASTSTTTATAFTTAVSENTTTATATITSAATTPTTSTTSTSDSTITSIIENATVSSNETEEISEDLPKAEAFIASLDYDDTWDSPSQDSPTEAPAEEERFYCPSETGFFRHPTNCSRFYWCINSKPTAMFCSEGTAFDPETSVCSWIVGSDGCGGKLAAPTFHDRRKRDVRKRTDDVMSDVETARFHLRSGRHPRQTARKSGNEDRKRSKMAGRNYGIDSSDVDFSASEMPYQCPGDGFYADPQNCSIFYHCSNGKSYKHQCQPGTAFDKDKLVCSWPLGEDGCGSMLGVPYMSDEMEELRGTAKETSKFQCPDEMVGYYPDPEDCTVFHHCADGKQFRHKCGNGTAFNQDTGVCSWPINFNTGCGSVLHNLGLDGDKKISNEGTTTISSVRRNPRLKANDEPHQLARDTSNVHKDLKPIMQDEPTELYKSDATVEQENQTESQTTIQREASTLSPSEHETNEVHNEESEIKEVKNSTENSVVFIFAKEAPRTISTRDAINMISLSDLISSTTVPIANFSLLSTNNSTEENMPSVGQSGQRISMWPWESVEKKRKMTRSEAYIRSSNTVATRNSDTQKINETASSLAPIPPIATATSSTEILSLAPSTATSGILSKTSTIIIIPTASTSAQTSTISSIITTPTTSTSAQTNASTLTTVTASEELKLATTAAVKADAYRVMGAETGGFRCPFPTGHFRDPLNCAVYYHCEDGVAFRKDCPSEELYDVNQHRCLPILEVKDCRRVDEKRSDWEEQWLSKYPEMDSFPGKFEFPDSFQCPELYGYFKNELDCTSYFECMDGVPYLRKCMLGTVFDLNRKKCTWSSLVPDCRLAARNIAEDESIKTNEFKCPSPDGYYRDQYSCSTYYHCIDGTAMTRVCDPNFFFDPQTSKCRWVKLVKDCDKDGVPVILDKIPLSSFVCPLPNGHYRDPDNCSVFYHCLGDVPYRGACRYHHAFDVITLSCVPRSEVPGCEVVAPPSQESNVDDQEKDPIKSSSNDTSSQENKGEDTPQFQATGFRCPKAHGLYRDPSDCSVFYHCFSGRHFRHECQFGTVFSVQRNLCTWPSLVPDCEEVTQSPETTSLAPDTTEEAPEWKAQTSPMNFSRHQQQQDATGPTTTTTTEATRDVTQRRFDDIAESRPLKNVSEKVNAPAELEAFDYDFSEVHTPDPSSDGVNRFIVEAPLPNSVHYEDFICPVLVFDQYFRDPLDCTRFHRCVKGLHFMFDCPRGTFFDPVYNVCDFQERVPDCDHEGKRLGSSKDHIGEVPKPIYTGDGGEYMSEPAPDVPVGNLCPKSDGLFAHPSSCQKFIYCSHGTPVVLTCPADLLYNTDTMTCDYDQNTVCIRYDK